MTGRSRSTNARWRPAGFCLGFNNRGNALQAMGRNDEAIASFERALALKPDLTAAHNNVGMRC